MGKICDEQYYVEIRGTYLDNFGLFQTGGALGKIVNSSNLDLTPDGIAGHALSGELAYWYKIGFQRFNEAGWRLGAVSIAVYAQISSTNCRCSDDSCRVECVGQPNGFCCIDHSTTDRLLQVLQN